MLTNVAMGRAYRKRIGIAGTTSIPTAEFADYVGSWFDESTWEKLSVFLKRCGKRFEEYAGEPRNAARCKRSKKTDLTFSYVLAIQSFRARFLPFGGCAWRRVGNGGLRGHG